MDRWKAFAVLGWSLVGAALLAGAGDRQDLRVKSLVVEGEQGQALIVAGSDRNAPYLRLLDDRNKRTRLWLSLGDDGTPSVTLYDGAGKEVLDVTGHADGPKVTYRVSGGAERHFPARAAR